MGPNRCVWRRSAASIPLGGWLGTAAVLLGQVMSFGNAAAFEIGDDADDVGRSYGATRSVSSFYEPAANSDELSGNDSACGACDCGSNCADGCGVCCTDCGPWLRVRAGAIFLDRSRPDEQVLMRNSTNAARQLNAPDFEFDYYGGWDVAAIAEMTDDWGVEARGFAVDGWNATATTQTNAQLLRINTTPPLFAPNVDTVNARYGSELLSTELNLRRAHGDVWTWLAGLRYVELDEQLASSLVGTAQTFTYDTQTQNRMYGFQLGGEAVLLADACWQLDATVKSGIYHNSSRHLSELDTGAVTRLADAESNRAAFLGEVAVGGSYALTNNLSLRAGYNLVWIESVALASDQIPATNLFDQRGIDTGGGVFYHGALVGLEFTR